LALVFSFRFVSFFRFFVFSFFVFTDLFYMCFYIMRKRGEGTHMN